MLQIRIHNALRELAQTGEFYSLRIDQRTGVMSQGSRIALPAGAASASPIRSSFAPAKQFRGRLASERTEWLWELRIEIPGQAVAFEAFENSLLASDISIPDPEDASPSRSLLARLESAEYNPVPEASPNRGAVAVFTFSINPLSLRM